MSEVNKKATENDTTTVRWYGYLVLVIAILFFSGVFKDAPGGLQALDFTNLAGSFGRLGTLEEGAGTLAGNFRGTGGNGARDALTLSLTLIPTIMLALGVIGIVEKLDGIKAAQKLLAPILRPLMGVPGAVGLTLVASLQSTDAGAALTKELRDSGIITEKEKTIFAAFQYSSASAVSAYLSVATVMHICVDEIGMLLFIPLIVQLLFKVFGANLMRLYFMKFEKEGN